MLRDILGPAMQSCGISWLQPYQELCIFHILNAAGLLNGSLSSPTEEPRRRIVILPTGYGKTLCFTLPSLLLSGPTLVIYPLRALMSDQERRFRELGIPCVSLLGGLSASDRAERLELIASGQIKLVLANPEILATQAIGRSLSSIRFSHIVIDEAHVIEQWGSSFRPAYASLANLFETLHWDQMSAFTATADSRIISGIRSVLGDSVCYQLAAPSDRPEIKYRVLHSAQAELTLTGLLNATDPSARVKRPCLVFVRNRAACEWLSLRLAHTTKYGPVKFYHAGLSRSEKLHAEHWFYHSQDGVLISTNAYGMGVDKANIRTVIHLGLPDSVSAYLQESGRAGRDRSPAEAIALVRIVAGQDWNQATANSAIPNSFLDGQHCRRQILSEAMDMVPVDCSGCDVCDGTVTKETPEIQELCSYLRTESGQILLEDFPDAIHRQGKLTHFSRNQIRQILHHCLATQKIRFSRSPLSWKRLR